MIELRDDALVFTFPEVHEAARFRVDFQRTLRIPDDGDDYPLPPGLGRFPLRHVDDFASGVPARWLAHGGVMLPMYQSEALWLNFRSLSHEAGDAEAAGTGEAAGGGGSAWIRMVGTLPYPFAVKIATGKINAVTGEAWEEGLDDDPQDYMAVPEQPWLDGYCVEKGIIRQFVAMPLGAGYTAEEQLTGEAEHGGLQIVAYPMKAAAYRRRLEAWKKARAERGTVRMDFELMASVLHDAPAPMEMGLAPGGRMRQEIYDDPYGLEEWDTERGSRCFVHMTNSLVWRAITGGEPPTTPPTASHYTRMGLPWFEYYSDAPALDGAGALERLKSVLQMGKEKGDIPLPENDSVTPDRVVRLRRGLLPGQVREGRF